MSSEENKLYFNKNNLLKSPSSKTNSTKDYFSQNQQLVKDSFDSSIIKPEIENLASPQKPKKKLNKKDKLNSSSLENSPLKENYKNNNKIAYFQSEKIDNLEKKENYEKPCCYCVKTKCIKNYCECFANKKFCKDCHCIDCKNKFIYQNRNNRSKNLLKKDKIVCNCLKSSCLKKYCDCYKSGNKCNEECNCLNCMNLCLPSFTVINKNNNNSNKDLDENNGNNYKFEIDLDEEKSESKQSLNDDLSENYQIQRISIFVTRNETFINVKRFTKEDMLFISKKRNYY